MYSLICFSPMDDEVAAANFEITKYARRLFPRKI